MNQLQSTTIGLILAGSLLALPACTAAGGAVATRPPAPASAHPRDKGAAPAAGVAEIHAERIPVAFADVEALAAILQDIFGVRGPGDGEGPVRAILVDDRTRDLIVFGTDEGIARVRKLLAPACDPAAAADGEGVEVVPLAHAAATEILHVVAPMAGPRTLLMADEPTNSLVIRGVPEQRERLRRVIAALDLPAKSR